MTSWRALLATLALQSGEAALLTTKRTMSSVDGYQDEKWFDRYFGIHDNASTYGPGLQRNLAKVLPMGFGIHFPNATGSVHVSGNDSIDALQLANVEAMGNLTKYSGLLDWATLFYVPELSGHVEQFQEDSVATLKRQYTADSGESMYSLTVFTPASGHVMELQSEVCDGCDDWAPFGDDECELGHRLPRAASFYRAAWQNASTADGMWAVVGNHLPPGVVPPSGPPLVAPMVVQIRQAVTSLDSVQAFLHTVVDTKRADEGQCSVVSAVTGAGPFDDDYRGPGWSDFPLQIAYVRNGAQQRSLRRFTDFLDRLHSERVGFGWGWDRGSDYHIKFTDSTTFNVESMPGVALDHWAAQLAAHKVRFSAFNLSQFCPSSDPTLVENPERFGGASMLYTAGPGFLGIEFWGFFDYSYFSKDEPLFFWGGSLGSPTSDCRSYLSPPDCAKSATSGSATAIRARAAANPPTNSVYATLECPRGHFIEGVSFARFGTPSGDCDDEVFEADSSCDVDIGALVKTLCVGRSSCRVPASTALFGTPCESPDGWWTAVEVQCASSEDSFLSSRVI